MLQAENIRSARCSQSKFFISARARKKITVLACSRMLAETIRDPSQGNVAYRQRVLQRVTSLCVVSLVFRGHDLRKIANINPQQEATLSLVSSQREHRKWSLGLG